MANDVPSKSAVAEPPTSRYGWLVTLGLVVTLVAFSATRWWEKKLTFGEFEHDAFVLATSIRNHAVKAESVADAVKLGLAFLPETSIDFVIFSGSGSDTMIHNTLGPITTEGRVEQELLARSHYEVTLNVNGESWRFLCVPAPDYFSARHAIASRAVLAFGVVITIFLWVYIRRLIDNERRMNEIDKLRTAQQLADSIGRKLKQPMTALLLALHHIELSAKDNDGDGTTASLIRDTLEEMNQLIVQLVGIVGQDEEAGADSDQPRLNVDSQPAQLHRPRRVLIIEDSVSLLKLLQKLVTDFGLEADAVENGEDAIDRIMNNEYGLVLADIMLPGKSGVDVYLETRRKHAGMEFIFLSGFALQERWLPLLKESGGFIPKPYTPDAITGILQRVYGDDNSG